MKNHNIIYPDLDKVTFTDRDMYFEKNKNGRTLCESKLMSLQEQ
ncbi:MAG: hypothetical protein WC175_04720 [Candidatus Dojkabacteria bacterium]